MSAAGRPGRSSVPMRSVTGPALPPALSAGSLTALSLGVLAQAAIASTRTIAAARADVDLRFISKTPRAGGWPRRAAPAAHRAHSRKQCPSLTRRAATSLRHRLPHGPMLVLDGRGDDGSR